jgi:AcrR family transcriptional regulator
MEQEARSAPPTMWERARQMASQEILGAALRLFTEQGYDETTIAQIAREAGVSQRTLFRYFGSKEDLIGVHQEALAELLKKTAEEQPVEVSAWDALRAGLLAMLTAHDTPEQGVRRLRLVVNTPSLRAGYIERQLCWQAELLPFVAARMGIGAAGPDPRARALLATAFACADATIEAWVADDGKADITRLFDDCAAAVRASIPPIPE